VGRPTRVSGRAEPRRGLSLANQRFLQEAHVSGARLYPSYAARSANSHRDPAALAVLGLTSARSSKAFYAPEPPRAAGSPRKSRPPPIPRVGESEGRGMPDAH